MPLNGQWDFIPNGLGKTKIQVPGFYIWNTWGMDFPVTGSEPYKLIEGIPETTYEKTFQVPTSMNNKRISLRFESVNFVCDIYLNGVLIGSNNIGFVPFELDITNRVQVPSNNLLRVEIKYYTSRFRDTDNNYVTPTGYNGAYWNLGITGDVSLIARPKVYIEDTWVQTSVRQDSIISYTTITNTGASTQSFSFVSYVERDGAQVFYIGGEWEELAPGESKTIRCQAKWDAPILWTISNPYLYQHNAELLQNATIIHRKSHAFGFREFWAEGAEFYMNGHPIHLRGDNVVIFGEKDLTAYLTPTPQAWASILDSLKALNFNVIRFSASSSPSWMLDACDEKGMLLIADSNIGRGEITRHSLEFQSAANDLVARWVRKDRNHPSIIIWAVENELAFVSTQLFNSYEVSQWGKTAIALDPTRLTLFEGDRNLPWGADYTVPIYSLHYFLNGNNSGKYPYLSIWPTDLTEYFGQYVHSTLPTSWGEYEFNRFNILDNKTGYRRQCLVTRTGRMLGVDDLRPYRLDWAWHPNPAYYDYFYAGKKPDASDILFLKNTMNPCAAFDKTYYAASLFPSAPVFNEGATASREIVVFNEEEGETLQLRWEVRYANKSVSAYSQTLQIPTGNKIETTISFEAPYVPQQDDFTLRLSTWKNNQQLFYEDYAYKANDIGLNPPLQISGYGVEPWQNHVRLSWDQGIPTAEGTTDRTYEFYIYKSVDPDFSAGMTKVIGPVHDSLYVDETFVRSADSLTCWFYRMIAKKNAGLQTQPTDAIGVMNVTFVSPIAKTRINAMGLPFELPGTGTASAMIESLPYCQSLAVWAPSDQNYLQYHPDIPPTDFDITTGETIYIHANQDTVFTWIGTFQPFSYSLTHNENPLISSWNDLVLPPDHFVLRTASQLCSDIEGAETIARWDAQIQGFENQYIPGLSETDFTIHTGNAYHIFMGSNAVWPENNAPAKTVCNDPMNTNLVPLLPLPLPHMVWGTIESSQRITNFKAFISTRPEDILSSRSAGCKISSDHWFVQCASFESPWRTGDTLKVQLFEDNQLNNTYSMVLRNLPAEEMEHTSLETDLVLPDHYALNPCYPNPFNAHLIISYELPEAAHVRLLVFDATGRQIATLFDGMRQAGNYQETWNGSSGFKGVLASGVYIIRMQTGNLQFNRKVILLK